MRSPRPVSRAKAVTSRSQLTKIAQLYYIENVGQREIAERLNISITSVSRSLAKAKQLDIVQISINTGANDYSQIEIEMERKYSLRECLLVPSFGRLEYAYEHMGPVMADLLGRLLKRGSILGVSWGETMKAISENLPKMFLDRVDVIPIIGAMGKIETGMFPNSIARTFAERLGGETPISSTRRLSSTAPISASRS